MRVSWLVLLFVSVPVVVLAEGQARDEAATKEGLVDRMSKKPSEARDAVRQDRPDAAGEKIRHELRETVRDQREEPSEKGDDVTEEQREVVAREKEASEASPSVPADNGLIVTVAAADAGLFAATLTISLADSRLLGDCNATLELTLPWQLVPLYHTLTVTNATVLQQRASPGRRPAPSRLAVALHVPLGASPTVSLAVTKLLTHADMFDHEPFRGIRVPPVRVVAHCVRDAATAPVAIEYPRSGTSQALRVPLAVPDMSMPFNVLMITGTLWSMAFGSLLALAAHELRATPLTPPRTKTKAE